MNADTMKLVAEVMQLLMTAAGTLPAAIEAGRLSIELLQSDADPSPEQMASIRAALDIANADLQAAKPAGAPEQGTA